MKNTNSNYLHKKQIKKKRNRKLYYTISLFLAAIVVFSTVYSLILPAITLEKETHTLNCPLNIHQHTEQCYDSENNLTCGESDFVIHTHEDNCFDEEGNQTCKLPEIFAHKHSTSCYNKKGDLICTLAEVVEHTHNDLCYDKDGTLICGKPKTIKHIHGAACFTPKSTEEGTTENNISILSDTSEATGSTEATNSTETINSTEATSLTKTMTANLSRAGVLNEDCGYKDDGSIYWGGHPDFQQVAANKIQENTPYLISGWQDNNLMADETFTKGDATYLKAIPKAQITDYKQYQRWYFEKANEDGKYYVYFSKANEDGTNTPLYLRYAGYGVNEWGKKTLQTALTEDKTQATVFKVERCTDSKFPNHITISADVDGNTFFVNSYFGDKPLSNGNTTHWLGYEEYSDGSFLRISQYGIQSSNTAKRVKTNASTNSVINLFDYWITPNRNDPDNVNPVPSLLETGINNGHDFKFTKGDAEGSYKLNYWTGSRQLPRSGIVSPNLDEHGYPVLSGNNDINGTTSTESLEYLFNPKYEHEGKASYKNVGGLLTVDNQGYYSFSSKKNMAEFNEQQHNIYLYDKPGVTGSGIGGQFFPFNKAPQIMTANREDQILNHYFGMSITTRFIQLHDGYTSSKKNTKTSFHFSGDDDVWIFIDGVLVGDVGGIHDASSVDIDFATGGVQVAVAGGTKAPLTTIRECYRNAGKEADFKWNGNTYANNTTHTLKFYYLERGNYASNLELQFNLTEIPKTAISKTDEYGKPVQGAKFAVYAADSSYNMLHKKGGSPVENLPDTYEYDVNGNFVDGAGELVNALYVGTTDSNGQLLFKDSDDMPYTIDEINALFGDNFILREIEVPNSYRTVSDDVHLQIWHGENQSIIRCDNVLSSGARAATDLQVTATDTIYLGKEFGGRAIQYCDPDTGEPNCNPDTGEPVGTLFAVVCKFIGEKDTEGNIINLDDITNDDKWTPLYGSDEEGYELIKNRSEKTLIQAVIEAAKEAQKHGDVAFSYSNSTSTMKLTLDNLPGNITSYYKMLPLDQKKKTEYHVTYYWTDAPSIDKATPQNTYTVNANAHILDDGTQYTGFERIFSAEVQIPNLKNNVFVQKVDENNNLINGATFGLYQVQQADNGEIFWKDSANGSTASSIPFPKKATPDPVTGAITVDGKTITPLKTDVTAATKDGVHPAGTVEFDELSAGQYIIKEIKAPPGYKINTSDIMVLVTKQTIYANAGTEDDGVTVGRGPGYLVSPLTLYASEGEIDDTLTWIYAQMRISKESESFADVGNESMIKEGYLMKNYSGETTTDPSQIFKTYLIYAKDKTGTPFNYIPNADRNKGLDSDGYRRLFTTVGWPYYEVYQDFDYGYEQAKKYGANYRNLHGTEITNLFSRSSYIRVTDTNDVSLKIKKVDSTNKEALLSDAQFRMYRLNADKNKEYYVRDDQGNVSWNTDVNTALVVTTSAENMAKADFKGLHDGIFYLEEIKAPDGYTMLSKPVEMKIEKAVMTLISSEGCSINEGELNNNLYTFTVTIPNSTGYELPAAGGSGTIIYTTGGILLILISLVCGYKQKRRSERRFK